MFGLQIYLCYGKKESFWLKLYKEIYVDNFCMYMWEIVDVKCDFK